MLVLTSNFIHMPSNRTRRFLVPTPSLGLGLPLLCNHRAYGTTSHHSASKHILLLPGGAIVGLATAELCPPISDSFLASFVRALMSVRQCPYKPSLDFISSASKITTLYVCSRRCGVYRSYATPCCPDSRPRVTSSAHRLSPHNH